MSVDAASDGDDAEFDPVGEAEKVRRLEAVAPMVRAMCAARLHGRGSDDAAQAVLEQVWRAQHQQAFENEESVRRYAATVARVMPASADRRSVRAAPVGSVAEALWLDEAPGPAERFDRTEAMAEAADKVAALLAQLTPRERDVIRATHLGERSTADAAAELGLTPSGVRSAQTRAMARMRESMDTASTNPLASGLPERERRRSTERQAGRGYPQGPRSAPVIEAAERFTSEQGRPPSRAELVGLTETSNGTAQRVIRALRDEREARGREPADVPAGSTDLPAEPHDHRPDIRALDTARGPHPRDMDPEVADERRADEDDTGRQLELVPITEQSEADLDRVGTARAGSRPDLDIALQRTQAAIERARTRGAAARGYEEADLERAAPARQAQLWDTDDDASLCSDPSDTSLGRDDASGSAGP